MVSLASKGSEVMLCGYTYDREDLTELLLLAAMSGARVRVLLDQNSLFGRTRDMSQQAIRLVQGGVEVRMLQGESVTDHYKSVGRSVSNHIRGIHHSKSLLVDEFLLVGSCNWTTSSRANFETGVIVKLTSVGLANTKEFLLSRWSAGSPASVEDLRRGSPNSKKDSSLSVGHGSDV
jgi:phosphatidylserine/phosphatidylglycerophosphate/cardiolipin synthase-like enzyme